MLFQSCRNTSVDQFIHGGVESFLLFIKKNIFYFKSGFQQTLNYFACKVFSRNIPFKADSHFGKHHMVLFPQKDPCGPTKPELFHSNGHPPSTLPPNKMHWFLTQNRFLQDLIFFFSPNRCVFCALQQVNKIISFSLENSVAEKWKFGSLLST